MAAAKYNLKIEQGATFEQTITWKAGEPAVPVDITGCTARMHARERLDETNALLTLTTENGAITLGGVAGTISLALTAIETAAITWARGVYDLELVYPDGRVRRLLTGKINVSPEVTR